MKKFLLSTFILLNFLLVFVTNSKSQVVNIDDPERTVFWFDVNVRTVIDKETYLSEYTVARLGKRVYSGTLSKYEESLWAGMAAGAKIVIGPFSLYDDAYEAMLMYDLKDTMPIENTTEKYWYLVKIVILERSKSYEFDRMAAAVSSGTKSEFKDILVESLGFKTLAIGPFTDQLDAEESKRIYRLEE